MAEDFIRGGFFEGALAEKVLYDPVFERVKADDRDTATTLQYINRLPEHVFQCAEFIVHFDAQCLKDLGKVFLRIAFYDGLHGGFEFTDRADGRYGPLRNDRPGQRLRIGDLPVLFEEFMQLLLGIIADDCCCRQLLALIHPHVQGCVEAGRETTIRFIELVTGNAEVGKDPIHLLYPMQTKKALQVPKIFRNKQDPFISGNISGRVLILVESDQPALCIQALQYRQTMTTAAERAIDIDAVGLYVKATDAFVKQYRHVVS